MEATILKVGRMGDIYYKLSEFYGIMMSYFDIDQKLINRVY
jgi:hypothetical protein